MPHHHCTECPDVSAAPQLPPYCGSGLFHISRSQPLRPLTDNTNVVTTSQRCHSVHTETTLRPELILYLQQHNEAYEMPIETEVLKILSNQQN